ncbi:MAG TPA: thioredoxin domain-containing protein [Bryobacteraceae bacterium]|nr:thioredoxin domain-containing protein [Bryobacteraceae bacterium]
MTLRKLALPLFVAALCLGQATWQTVTDPPGVDWKGLTGPKKAAALRIMQAEGCNCGCSLKIAECRIKDSACGVSRNLASVVVKAASEGKSTQAIKGELDRIASQGPPVLEEPVTISTAGDPVLGPANAKITIVEFSDFQCPYCSKAVAETKEIMRQMPNVKLIFKQFPLDSHSEAAFGAEVSLAAQAQGKFWEMHDLLYAGFPDLTRARINSYARQLNLDIKRFNAELESHKYKARVQSEEKEGEAAGVDGTPKFFFNGRRYNGVFDAKTVVPLLKKEFK